VALPDRLVRALCPESGIVFDPYMGSGSTGVAAIINGRRFLGAEVNRKYELMAYERLIAAHRGTVSIRPTERPLYTPRAGDAIARRPT
jgi:adenine-specific DNA-methyltransferase